MEIKYIVKKDDNYLNINDVLSIEFKISSRLKLKLINMGRIYLNGVSSDTRATIKPNDMKKIILILCHKIKILILYMKMIGF